MEAPFYHDDVIALHPFGQPSAFASYSGKNLLRQGKAAGQIPSLSGLQAAASVGAPLLAPASSSSSSSLVSPSPPQPLQQPPPPPAPQASALPSSSAAAPSSSSSSSAASSTSSSPAESAMLRLSSSDMERFIIHHHHQQQQHHHQNHHHHHHHQLLHSGGGGGRAGLPTPMSAGLALGPAGSSAFNHGCSAEEKDNFANGFVRALEELHKQNIRQSGSSQLAVTAAGVAGGTGALSPSSLTQLHCSPGLSYDAHHHHQHHHHQQQPSYAALQQLSDSRHGSGSNCYAELGGYGPQLGLASGIAATLQQQQQGLSSAAGAAAGLEYVTTSGLYAQSPLQYLPRSQQQLLLLKEEETLQTVPDLMQDAGASTLSTLTTVSTTSSSTCSTSSSSSSAAGGAAGGGGCGGGGGPSELALERAATAPVDMESQEKMKVERKRLRNRIAASKCRKRKLERIARLEEKVAALKANNAQLAGTAGTLRDQVDKLKQRVLNHLGRGCRLAIGATQGTALQAF